MATGRITKDAVDGLQRGSRDIFLWDDKLKGFGLKITPAGKRVYLLQYRMGGRGTPVRRYTIGTHGSPWTAATARGEAERLLIEVRRGTDVMTAKKERTRVATDLKFESYVSRFVDGCLKEKWAASWQEAERSLRRYVVPIIGDKALPDIRRGDISAVLGKLRGKTATRRNVYAVLLRMFNWAVSEGDLTENPMTGMEAPALPPKRNRKLDDNELRLAWLAAGGLGRPFGPILRVLMASGQRLEEVGGLDWRELDRGNAIWNLPAERAKNNQAHDVPLNPLVIAELDKVAGAEKWPRRGLVFSTNGETPPSGYSRAKSRLDRDMLKLSQAQAKKAGERLDDVSIEPWRFHDFRRTVASGLQRVGVRFEVTEAILNHVSGAKAGVAGIYQQHDWAPEKRDALNAWGAHLERVLTGADQSKVIHLAARRT